MAREKITDEQWASARLTWESEPLKNHADIGKILGCSKQAVQKKAAKDGWQKRITVEEATERAYRAADDVSDEARQQGAGGAGESAPVVVAASAQISPAASDAGADAAVDARADLLRRHRREMNGPRALALQAIKTKDLGLARTAKAAAETLRVAQEAERKAWGFDRDDGKPGAAVTVVIERGRRRGS